MLRSVPTTAWRRIISPAPMWLLAPGLRGAGGQRLRHLRQTPTHRLPVQRSQLPSPATGQGTPNSPAAQGDSLSPTPPSPSCPAHLRHCLAGPSGGVGAGQLRGPWGHAVQYGAQGPCLTPPPPQAHVSTPSASGSGASDVLSSLADCMEAGPWPPQPEQLRREGS